MAYAGINLYNLSDFPNVTAATYLDIVIPDAVVVLYSPVNYCIWLNLPFWV